MNAAVHWRWMTSNAGNRSDKDSSKCAHELRAAARNSPDGGEALLVDDAFALACDMEADEDEDEDVKVVDDADEGRVSCDDAIGGPSVLASVSCDHRWLVGNRGRAVNSTSANGAERCSDGGGAVPNGEASPLRCSAARRCCDEVMAWMAVSSTRADLVSRAVSSLGAAVAAAELVARRYS